MNPTKAWCVTGGAGFIGSHLVEHLLSTGVGDLEVDRLLVIDALTYAGRRENLDPLRNDSRLHFEHRDLADEEAVLRLLENHEIGGIFHLAAETHVDRSIDNPDPFLQSNVVATGRLLSATRRHWKNLGGPEQEAFRFLHVSTDEVYG
ncbi:MAG: GDP-mannose 4,6-dehydratase, partial [Verrucomicrobiota bacterium]